MTVDTLADVLAISHPGTLHYKAFTRDGTRILLPTLGVLDAPHEKPSASQPPPVPIVDANTVRTEILDTVRRVSGSSELNFDKDGDIPLRFGNTMVFVRVLGEPPIVHVFSPVLQEIQDGRAIADALNEINANHAFAKWYEVNGVVMISLDLFGKPLVPEHVIEACSVLSSTADELDEQRQAKVGGRTFFGQPVSPKQGPASGGYL